jgi:hypothetical protein
MRLCGKTALSLLGLCLGGMLYASDPEAGIKASVQDLRDLTFDSIEQRSIDWYKLVPQVNETCTRYVEAERCLTNGQRRFYLDKIRACLQLLDRISD